MSLSTFVIQTEKGETIILDKQKCRMQVFPDVGHYPKLQITSLVDIVGLRDLLIDAYPLDVFVRTNP
ncbi:hypothetical protein J2Z32_002323 [Paenibacillus turicensis]|uniref:Uncharacterized protein n=1 Tax=Paenibacillus turicensis TaxID=160487 RepID=A0ABS4FSW9_9BACL|nr:hypothetical protein [Paenibacillus turicensis]